MSERGYLDWDDTQLQHFCHKLVTIGEQMQNKNAGSHFAGYDIAIAHNTQINNLYVKALIMQLERLNNKIDKLIEKK